MDFEWNLTQKIRAHPKLCLSLLWMLIIAVSLMGLPQGEAYRGGASDQTADNDSCDGCHGTVGTGTIDMDAPTLTVGPSSEFELTVNVTETDLTGDAIIGTFLMNGITQDDDLPSNDGWTIVSDPNGGTNNYVELTSPGSGSTVPFTWTLQAPATDGSYTLVAMSEHGGAGAHYEAESTGLTFVVRDPTIPYFVEHNFPTQVEVDEELTFNATVEDSDGVDEVYISWFPIGSTLLETQAMTLVSGTDKNGVWEGSLPTPTEAGEIEFDITATDRENWVTCHPQTHTITVQPSGTPIIEHEPVNWAYVQQKVNLTFSVAKASSGVSFHYRWAGETYFNTLVAHHTHSFQGAENYTVPLPAQSELGVLEYYLMALNGSFVAQSPTHQMDIKPRMDVAVADLELMGEPELKGEIVLLVKLINQGTNKVEGLWLKVYNDRYETLDASYVGWAGNLSLEVDEELVVPIFWIPNDAGTQNLRVIMDANQAVDEVNETNNVMNLELEVTHEAEPPHHEAEEVGQALMVGLILMVGGTLVLLYLSTPLAKMMRGHEESEGSTDRSKTQTKSDSYSKSKEVSRDNEITPRDSPGKVQETTEERDPSGRSEPAEGHSKPDSMEKPWSQGVDDLPPEKAKVPEDDYLEPDTREDEYPEPDSEELEGGL